MTMTDPGVALEHAPAHSLAGPPSPEQAREAMETVPVDDFGEPEEGWG